jgi:hypothetical protein
VRRRSRNDSQSRARPDPSRRRPSRACGRPSRPRRRYPGRSRRRGSAQTRGASGGGTNFRQGATISANATSRTSGLAAPPPPADDCTVPWGPREPCGMGSPRDDAGRAFVCCGSNCGARTGWIRRGGASGTTDGSVEDWAEVDPLPAAEPRYGRPYAATKLPIVRSRARVASRALVHPGVGTPGGVVDD